MLDSVDGFKLFYLELEYFILILVDYVFDFWNFLCFRLNNKFGFWIILGGIRVLVIFFVLFFCLEYFLSFFLGKGLKF